MNATRSPLEGQERCPPPGPARSSHPTPTGDVDPTPAAEPGATRALYVDVHAGGILKRVDGGTGWSVAAATMRGWSVLSLAFDPASPRFVYAGTWSGGVWKSTDAGADGQTAVMGLAIDLQNPRNVYAAVDSGFNGGVHCSADGGAMWTCSTGGPPHNFRLHALGVAQRTEQSTCSENWWSTVREASGACGADGAIHRIAGLPLSAGRTQPVARPAIVNRPEYSGDFRV